MFDLETFYQNMKIGEDPWEGMSYEDWLAANPIPEKWTKRLAADDVDLALARKKKK